MNLRDTIVAISTPIGRSGLGVVRLSGENSRALAEAFLHFPSPPVWLPFRARLASLRAVDGSLVDRVMVTYFAAPRSYTAEDVIEISCHGAPVILNFCLERALESGARLATPGEFTLRAFLHNRIDLPQAEGIRDLIEANTLYQARMAASQMEGSVSRRLRPAKERLTELIALLEAGIDFAEDDISVASAGQIEERLTAIESEISDLRNSFDRGRLATHGFTLAVAGRPNVGKSSLFNRLLAQERAIVTPIAGTTRDTISEVTTLSGLPLRLVDTAGVRASEDPIETLGVQRTYEAMADADLVMLVLDGSSEWTAEDDRLMRKLEDRRPLLVANKSDLPWQPQLAGEVLRVSALKNEGIDTLRDAIVQRIAPQGLASPEEGAITSIRHLHLLKESLEALVQARNANGFQLPHELILLDLYAALRPLDAIAGATTADDILNRIFATFCIGK